MTPLPCDHDGRNGLGAVEDAFEVDADHQIEVGFGHLLDQLAVFDLDKGSVPQDPGVVDEDVYTAVLTHHRINPILHILPVGYIDFVEIETELIGNGRAHRLIHIANHNLCAFFGKALRRCLANTSCAASYKRYSIFQSHFLAPSFWRPARLATFGRMKTRKPQVLVFNPNEQRPLPRHSQYRQRQLPSGRHPLDGQLSILPEC